MLAAIALFLREYGKRMRVQPHIAAVSNLLRSLLPLQVNNSSNHIDLAEIHPVWPGPNTKKQKRSLNVSMPVCASE